MRRTARTRKPLQAGWQVSHWETAVQDLWRRETKYNKNEISGVQKYGIWCYRMFGDPNATVTHDRLTLYCRRSLMPRTTHKGQRISYHTVNHELNGLHVLKVSC